ncbi:MAG: choice-of-anchor V domain-containing protein [Terriglobia bacterium]
MPKFSLLFLTAATILAIAPSQGFAHSYGPVARLTAAPGDNARACTSCHTGTLNSGTGAVKILLLSGPVYIPGVKQRISVEVSDPTQQRWGFEFSARLNSDLVNGQAGKLTPVDNLTQVICEDNAPEPCSTGVNFIQHTSAGTRKGTKNGVTFQFDWTPPATNAGPVTFYVAGNAANGDNNLTGDLIYTSSIQLNPVTPAAPSVPAGNVLSAATYLAGPVAPNSWVAIFGSNLGVTTRSWSDSDFVDGAMPTSLDGVSVILTAFGAPRRAYVGYVSPTQVNILLPSDTNSTTVQVQVKNGAGLTTPLPITVQANAPQLLTLDGKYVFAMHANGSIVGKAGLLPATTSSPATPGETVQFYGTGCGPTNPALTPGQTPSQTVTLATLPPVTIGGAAAPVSSAVLSPSNPGVCQIMAQIPSSAPNGDLPVVVQLGTFSSAPTLITVLK